MKVEVKTAIEELKRQFQTSRLTVRDDDEGGAFVVVEPVEIAAKFRPNITWFGFHIPAQYPYADIYPVFMGGDIKRVDGNGFKAPLTGGKTFEGRGAIQISRRSAAAQNGSQKAVAKILKILDFLESLE